MNKSVRVKPVFKVVKIEETRHYTGKDFVKKAGKIWAVFLYNFASQTYCCEITPSYELNYLGSVTENRLTDEQQEYLLEANAHREVIEYHHVATIDKLPDADNVAKPWDITEEDYEDDDAYDELFEEVLDHEQGNPTFT
jgi:hypothetical protein